MTSYSTAEGILAAVFELYLSELLKELLRHEVAVQLLPEMKKVSSSARNQTKGLFH